MGWPGGPESGESVWEFIARGTRYVAAQQKATLSAPAVSSLPLALAGDFTSFFSGGFKTLSTPISVSLWPSAEDRTASHLAALVCDPVIYEANYRPVLSAFLSSFPLNLQPP